MQTKAVPPHCLRSGSPPSSRHTPTHRAPGSKWSLWPGFLEEHPELARTALSAPCPPQPLPSDRGIVCSQEALQAAPTDTRGAPSLLGPASWAAKHPVALSLEGGHGSDREQGEILIPVPHPTGADFSHCPLFLPTSMWPQVCFSSPFTDGETEVLGPKKAIPCLRGRNRTVER